MKNRNVFAVIVLSLVTLGIYSAYWTYVTYKEMRALGQRIPSFWLPFIPVLVLLGTLGTALITFAYKTGVPVSPAPATGIIEGLTFIIGMLALLAVIPISIYWLYRYCQAVENVTNRQMTTGTAFGLSIVLNLFSASFIWPGIIQDAFNKVGASANQPNPPASYPTPTVHAPAYPPVVQHKPDPPRRNPFEV